MSILTALRKLPSHDGSPEDTQSVETCLSGIAFHALHRREPVSTALDVLLQRGASRIRDPVLWHQIALLLEMSFQPGELLWGTKSSVHLGHRKLRILAGCLPF